MEHSVNYVAKPVAGAVVNRITAGPTLQVDEREVARIEVVNSLSAETLIYRHGVLLPSSEDGVSYMTTPLIEHKGGPCL